MEKKIVIILCVLDVILLGFSIFLDERDGDVTDSLLIEKISGTGEGTVIVTYVARDEANNVEKVSRTLEARGGADREVE